MTRCPVCRGEERIRLPLRYDLKATAGPDIPEVIVTHRDYPCPECKADSAPYERLLRVTTFRDVPGDKLEFVRDAARRGVADGLLRLAQIAGAVQFDEYDAPFPDGGKRLVGTLCVVMPKFVASMEERVEARQLEVAEKVIAKSAHIIENLQPHAVVITKIVAIDLMKMVLREWREK